MSKILIITTSIDPSILPVIKEIEKSNMEVFRLNIDEIFITTSFSFDNENRYDFSFKNATEVTTNYDVIWFTSMLDFSEILKQRIGDNFQDDNVRNYIIEEYKRFMLSFYSFTRSKKWINEYWNVLIADNKLPNLKLASDMGFVVPKTLITNNPDKALAFCENLNWQVIIKSFNFFEFNYKNDLFATFSKRIDKNIFIKYQKMITYSPVFFQQYIEKKVELRAVVIGIKVYCAAIYSQNSDLTKDDWRSIPAEQLQYSVYDLDKEIADKLVQFNKTYNIQISTFDFIITSSDELYFLECNTNGEWYWLEETLGFPLSKDIADLLMS